MVDSRKRDKDISKQTTLEKTFNDQQKRQEQFHFLTLDYATFLMSAEIG